MSEHKRVLPFKNASTNAKYRFLIVNKSPSVIETLSRLIRSFEGDVDAQYTDGLQAVKHYLTTSPYLDVALIGGESTTISPQTLISFIRDSVPQAHVVVIVGSTQPDVLLRLAEAGCKHFIAAPYKRDTVYKIICTALHLELPKDLTEVENT